MSQHFAHAFHAYILAQSNRRGKRVPGFVIAQILLNGTQVGNFFEVGIYFLIAGNGDKGITGNSPFIFLNDEFRNFQQRHFHQRIGFLPFRPYPFLPVDSDDILLL